MAASPLSRLSHDQRTDLVRYLDPGDLRSLRVAAGRSTGFADPRLTPHLPLRLDRVPFLRDDDVADGPDSEGRARRWLERRRRLVIDDARAALSADRAARLAARGLLDAASSLRVHDCRRHGKVLASLARLPNLKSLTLVDHGAPGEALDELKDILRHVGRMRQLVSLDVEFDLVLPGDRLSFLRELRGLRHLRLVGFDLSAGLGALRGRTTGLTTLHLCHGNPYSSPRRDASERDLMDLAGGVAAVRNLLLEGFDELKGGGLGPFAGGALRHLAFKHCQELNPECLRAVGQMAHLTSLHFVMSSCDDVVPFDGERLRHLNRLSALRSLSLFYVLDSPADLVVLRGLTSLEVLNVAFDETLSGHDADKLCALASRSFPSLRRLRVFSEDGAECDFGYGRLTIEFAAFNFGDAVYLE